MTAEPLMSVGAVCVSGKEGHHQDVEKMNSHHGELRKLAECLGFPHDKPFSYDGAADFCHKKSSPEVDVAATEALVPS
ncbi:saxitoxin and tetrodotoxin-binding protein 1-like [Anarrhichthys ocellatus]|uniref:saxitoxin and tetrodotoxin-binding protein 1-like n=1 Tax=Anarrhichthys ocellatus TaxID=433405 RepID=UPI0012EEC32B|nr:saxitoxin and tetrodotoxin-binding protein 1-like [Anarrhichthys ocellatus]